MMKMKEKGGLAERVYQLRYLAAAVILFCCVLFEISGSSIGFWSVLLDGTYENSAQDNSGDLLGSSRSIRTDEWAVSTPMAFSQEYNHTGEYPYFSDTIRGDSTDAFIVYGQPVRSWEVIFRPFQIGYLFLGPSRGLSFFWCARMLALFLVSLEFGMYLTKKKKMLSVIYSVLVSCSPVVAWWFAINGLVEMLVFGQLAVLMFVWWMRTESLWKKVLLSAGIAWCGISYILVFYPSWQIPLGYAYLFLLIGIILRERKNVTWKKGPIILSAGVLFVLMAGVLGLIFLKSADTIKLVLNTSYPGDRSFVGGASLLRMFSWAGGLFFPSIDPGLGISNVCEEAQFFSFFPLGVILGTIQLVKSKKKDPLLITMTAGTCFLALYSAFPWPPLLAKVTLLSMCQGRRVLVGVGFLSILLIIYLISECTVNYKSRTAVVISSVTGVALAGICFINYTQFMGKKKALLLAAVIAAGAILIFVAMKWKRYAGLACYALIISFVSGMMVNPVHQGAESVYSSKLTQAIKEETEADQGEGLWMVEGLSFPYLNLPITVGAPTINTTNVYPNLDRWEQFDPDKKDFSKYNRYAHIVINIVDDSSQEPVFSNPYDDQLIVNLKPEQLETLEVKHIMSDKDLSGFSSEDIQFNETEKIGRFYLYNVVY